VRKLACSLFSLLTPISFDLKIFLIPLAIAPRADPTKVVLAFKLNSFLQSLITALNPKTIALEYEAPSSDVPPRKKELPSLHFLLDSEIT
jgi:hypothetical protein